MALLLKQDVNGYNLKGAPIRLSGSGDWRYCTITFSADVHYCTEADICYLQIADGDTTTNSAAHTGDNTRQTLTVEHTISECATKIEAVVYFNPTESMGIQVYDASLTMNYYEPKVGAGCPCCGSFVYDPNQPSTPWPND